MVENKILFHGIKQTKYIFMENNNVFDNRWFNIINAYNPAKHTVSIRQHISLHGAYAVQINFHNGFSQ